MTRVGSLVAVAACLLAAAVSSRAAPASAAPPVESGATPVTGGGGFDDAPVLGAGVFTDTLLPRETLFYAIRLKAGQHLRVIGTVDLRPGSRTRGVPDAAGGFAMTLFSPLRERLPSNERENAPDEATDEDVAVLDSDRAVSFARAAQQATEGEDWSGPGLYHVVAAMSATRFDLGARVEFPLRLRVDIDDERTAGPTATAAGPLDAPVSPAAVTVAGAHADERVSRAGASSAIKIMTTIGAMLLGALLVGCAVFLVPRFARPP